MIIEFLKYSTIQFKTVIFLSQSVQASRILTEKFSSENKENVIILDQYSKSSRVCIIFILNYGLVALSAYSSNTVSSNSGNNFLVLPHSGKYLKMLPGVFAEDTSFFSNILSL